ncbi:MAG: hypothetical protein N2Z20_01985, partial [Elusimicrobiales bacterium]|nr:hypothetical protein [Elusimicrobiales bacterium]
MNFERLFSQTQLITRDYNWKIYSTRHFDIYHTTESTRWLGYLEKYLENAYEKGKREYNPNLSKRIPFFFYSASKYFQQNTIIEVGEGTGGFTEPYKDRFVVYSDGSKRWLKYVIYHEFGHEIQFSILVDGWWESPKILKTIFYPMWMMEGLSENMTDDWDIALEDMYVRDYFLDGKLPSLDKLFGFGHLKPHQVTLGYKTGAKAIRFLKEEYGYDKPGLMLYLWRDSYDINTVLQKLIGIDIYKFDSKFKEYLSIRYLKQIEELNLNEISIYGNLVTSNVDDIPVFNVSPVAFGSTIAYISTITGYPSVVIEEMNTKKRIILDKNKTGLDYIPYSKFVLPVRYLSISEDGNYLFFTGRKNHKDFICIYEIGTGKFRKVPVNGVDEIGQINVSTDLKKIVFSAMKNSVYDIYETEFDLVLNSNEFNINSAKQLTNDDDYDSIPQYITNDEVVFICEEEKDDIIKNSICSVKNGKKYKIFDLIDVADFYYDKKNFIFYIVSSSGGAYDLYSYYTDGKFFKNTSVIGGVFTPYVNGEKIYFSYFRHGSIHVYESKPILLNYKKIEGENTLNLKEFEQSEFKVDSFKVYDYKLKFSTDLFFPAFLYSSSGGMYIFNYLQLSDYTSRHSVSVFTNYNAFYSYLDLRVSYLYNRYRTKFIFSGDILNYTDNYSNLKHKRNVFDSDLGLIYPLDLYSQIYFIFNLKNNFKDYKNFNQNFFDLKERKRGFLISYVCNKLEGLYLTAVN